MSAPTAVGTAVIDGVEMPLEAATLPMTDQGVIRGDGGFETMGVWSGRPFRRADHIARLQASLAAALLPPVDETALATDIDVALSRGAAGEPLDGALRIYVTASGTRVVLFSAQPVRAPLRWLQPVVAPWIRPVGTWALAGAKTMSYMPNMTTSRVAQAGGADDALLVSLEGVVLEGPTFGVTWVRDDVLYATTTDAGIVDSISRRTVLEVATDHGVDVQVAAWTMDDVLAADAVMTSSAVRPLRVLDRIGDHRYHGPTPVTEMLATELERRRRE